MRTEDRFRWNHERLALVAEQANLDALQGAIPDRASIGTAAWRDSIETVCAHLNREIENWQAQIPPFEAGALLESAPTILGLEQMGMTELDHLVRLAEVTCQSARQQLGDLPARWSLRACHAVSNTFPRAGDVAAGHNGAVNLRLRRRLLTAFEEAASQATLALQASILNRLIEAVDSAAPLAAACEEVYRSLRTRAGASQAPHTYRLEERLAQRRAAYVEALEAANGNSPHVQVAFRMGIFCSSLCDPFVRGLQDAEFMHVDSSHSVKRWREEVSRSVLATIWHLWNAHESVILQTIDQRILGQFADLIGDLEDWIDAAYYGHRESLSSEAEVESLRLEAREISHHTRVAPPIESGPQ